MSRSLKRWRKCDQKTRLVKWGNSHAVRISLTVREKTGLQEGDELEIAAKIGAVLITRARRRLRLKDLLARVTAENLHQEVDWGQPVGLEVCK